MFIWEDLSICLLDTYINTDKQTETDNQASRQTDRHRKTYRHTHTHTQADTDGQTDRQTHTHTLTGRHGRTDRKTDTHTHTHTRTPIKAASISSRHPNYRDRVDKSLQILPSFNEFLSRVEQFSFCVISTRPHHRQLGSSSER